MKEAVEELYSVRCSSHISSPAGSKHKDDFESEAVGYSGSLRGSVVIDYYPLCGRKSLKNPSYIINKSPSQAVNLERNPYVSIGNVAALSVSVLVLAAAVLFHIIRMRWFYRKDQIM